MNRFPDGARVCFIGDSITHNNLFVSHIVAYYRAHFPQSKVEFYNCGISGGTLTTILNVFDEDILPYAPTHAVLMIGINDANLGALLDSGAPRYHAVEEAFLRYKNNLVRLCQRLQETGTELTLCTPMPYAEYLTSDVAPYPGGSALLLAYAEYLRKFAAEQGYPICDYHAFATRTMQTEELYQADRVHPNPRGHYYMAKCFLAFQGLELGEEKELPSDIREWSAIVSLVRNTIATEHFILHDDFTTTQEERKAAIKEYLETEQTGPHVEYFKTLSAQYQEIKPKQQEHIAFITDFMKNQ